jgi:hypothetical protein
MTGIFPPSRSTESELGACLHDMLAMQDNLMNFSRRREAAFMEQRYAQLAAEIGVSADNFRYVELADVLVGLLAASGTPTPEQERQLKCFKRANVDIDMHYGNARALARLPADHRLNRLTGHPPAGRPESHKPPPGNDLG